MSYVFMKVLESAPERYDKGMRLLTLGRLEQVHADIASRLRCGDTVLDIGCGTGALAVLLAERGCHVTGIDIAVPLLDQADERVRMLGVSERVELREMGVVDLATAFLDDQFDAITSTLVFSELSGDEIAYTLAECRRCLRPAGRLLVADEILPDSAAGRIATFLLRLPFAILAYLLTQNTTHRVAGLQAQVEAAGFKVLEIERYLAGSLQLFVTAVEE
jgi:demethylmenaquinone methyltransferase/2-methoxy-6-polyprenyl-1,4-benzoquinol methylase